MEARRGRRLALPSEHNAPTPLVQKYNMTLMRAVLIGVILSTIVAVMLSVTFFIEKVRQMKCEKLDVQAICDEAHTGDVMLFTYRYVQLSDIPTHVIPILYEAYHGLHMGLVIRGANNKPYLVHVQIAGRSIYISDLEVYLRTHVNKPIVHWYQVIPNALQTTLPQLREHIQTIIDTYDVMSVLDFVKTYGLRQPVHKIHCNSFVGLMMERMGAFPVSNQPIALLYVPYYIGELLKASPYHKNISRRVKVLQRR